MRVRKLFLLLSLNVTVFLLLLTIVELLSATILLSRASREDQRLQEQYPLREMTFATSRLYQTHTPYRSALHNVSSDGFRSDQSGRSPLERYDHRRPNIFTFGGSSTFGVGVADGETWPAQLEQLLTEEHPEIQVLNMGIGAFTLHEETYLLTQLLIEGVIPDVVVFYDGINEEQCPEVDHSAPYRALELQQNPFTELLHRTSTFRLLLKLRERFLQPSPLPVAPRSFRNPNLTEEEYRTCAREEYIRHAQFIERLAQLYGFQALFLLQPHGAFLENAASYPFPFYGNPNEETRRFYTQTYDAIGAEASVAGLTHFQDLHDLLTEPARKRQDLFVDWQHPSAAGNAIVAQELARLLQPLLPQASPPPQAD
jgi:lysophospholipase L1-like esterase